MKALKFKLYFWKHFPATALYIYIYIYMTCAGRDKYKYFTKVISGALIQEISKFKHRSRYKYTSLHHIAVHEIRLWKQLNCSGSRQTIEAKKLGILYLDI